MERVKGICARNVVNHLVEDYTQVAFEEIPANAIYSQGLSTTGFNLLLSTDFPALEERQIYEIILIPKRKF
jgi:hypothetical protein